MLYRAGTNGGQGIDGAVKVCLLEDISSLVAFNMALQVKVVHVFTIVSGCQPWSCRSDVNSDEQGPKWEGRGLCSGFYDRFGTKALAQARDEPCPG